MSAGEADSDDDMKDELSPGLLMYHMLQVLLFTVVSILELSPGVTVYPRLTHGAAVLCFMVGAPPIVAAAVTALRRRTMDINCLMLLAGGSALALGQYFDGALVVILFGLATLAEKFCLVQVRKSLRWCVHAIVHGQQWSTLHTLGIEAGQPAAGMRGVFSTPFSVRFATATA